jgi:general secretion pathway protein I
MSVRRRTKSVRVRAPDDTGFTLLEVMVAVAIVAIALVPLLRLHLMSLDATIWAQDYTTAVMLAQKTLTEKMAPIPSERESGERESGELEPGEENGTFDEPAYARFQWQTLIEEKEELTLGEVAQPLEVQRIQVTITWQDGQRSRAYQLESYVVHVAQ